MESFDRRKFLKGSTVAAGVAGAMTVVPGALPALAKSKKASTSGQTAKSSSNERLADQPVVVHVRDPRTGQIDLFVGKKHVSVSDRALTARILDAAG
jgi:hypothetical protein